MTEENDRRLVPLSTIGPNNIFLSQKISQQCFSAGL
jgi:hypothetical protein